MTLLEHLQELRSRLFRAALGLAVGFGVGWWLSGPVKKLLQAPYCDLYLRHASTITGNKCPIILTDPAGGITLTMKIALWIGLIVAAPVWLYQLWAFIAPGLHRHERRWAYGFTAAAAPLFAAGAVLAYLVIGRGLEFLLSFAGADVSPLLDLNRYFNFVTGLILMFGVAFEFPLVVVLLNAAGVASARRLLGWWRWAVLVFFAVAGAVLPTGDPFSMVAMGGALTALYFAAVGFAYLNDKRRERRRRAEFGDVGDDEISPLNLDPLAGVDAAAVAASPREVLSPVARPRPLERRYDDMT